MQSIYIAIVCALLLYGIIKKLLPQGLLFLAGFALLGATVIMGWGHGTIPVKAHTGSVFFDSFALLKQIFSNQFANLGLVIMVMGGFAKYLSHIKASNKLVEYAVKPLSFIKKPYMLLSLFYILAVFLNMFITSAAGFGMLLMVTVYPILIGMGISKYSAVGMIVTTGCLELGPVHTNLVTAANLAKIDVSEYFIQYQLPVSIPAMLVIAISHYFWQKYCDQKMGHDVDVAKAEMAAQGQLNTEVTTNKDVPWFYALFPLIPFVCVLLFSKIAEDLGIKLGIKLDITSAILFSVAIVLVIDFIGSRANLRKALDNFNYFLKGMESMVPVVTLIVAGSFFAEGLLASGGIDILVKIAENSGLGATGMTIVMVLVIMGAAALMGSGNASFIPLASIAPPVAAKFGVSAVYMLLPMQLISSMARVLSPIVAVSIACAGMAGISTVDVVKRTSVPILLGSVVMLITSLMFV